MRRQEVGYGRMNVTTNRIHVMAMNEVGVIADISKALADEGISIETISAEGLYEKRVTTLTTYAYDGALRVLTHAGFKTGLGRVAGDQASDEPGALAKIAERFKNSGVNIQSFHIIDRRNGHVLVALSAYGRKKAETIVDSASIV